MSDAIQTGADAALQAPVTPAAVVSPVSIPDGVVASNRTKEAAQEWELTDDQPRPREAYWSRDKVVPSKTNPRKRFEEEALKELAENIRKHGILQPILCRPYPGDPERLEIIAGERRYRSAGLAGLAFVPDRKSTRLNSSH